MKNMSFIRNGVAAIGVSISVVLAIALLVSAQKVATLGSNYYLQTTVLLALPVSEGALLVSMFAICRRHRVAGTGLGVAFALVVWAFNGADLLVIVSSSAGAP